SLMGGRRRRGAECSQRGRRQPEPAEARADEELASRRDRVKCHTGARVRVEATVSRSRRAVKRQSVRGVYVEGLWCRSSPPPAAPARDNGTRTFAPPADTASFEPNGAGGRPESFPDVPGYEFTSVLGRGGMGVVYLARQIATNRQVAVKMLPMDGTGGEAG